MGQRLVVEIGKDNKLLATIYFHWSGYTRSTYEECRKIVNILEGKEVNSTSLNTADLTKLELVEIHTKRAEEDLRERLLRGMEDLGGGADIEDVEYIENTLGIKCNNQKVSRNNGLVQFSEAQMNDAIGWAEASARIDLDDRTINIVYAFCNYDEEYDGEYFKDAVFEKVPDDMPIFQMKFEDIERVSDYINSIDANGIEYEGEKFIFIE